MRKKIYGVTVGTPISPKAMEKELKPVKTVNGVAPDANGNVQVAGSAGDVQKNLDAHTGNKKNPHGVTAEQVKARPDTWTPTAQEVGARPDNWMPSASDVGAAPAGYGLGGNSVPISDCHVTNNGFYMWDGGCANAPFDYAVLLNMSRYGAVGSKLALCSGGLYQGCIAHKVGEEEWEYLNPPMEPNKEYRTTKRHNGKAIYTKMIPYAASNFVNAITTLPHGISNLDIGLSIQVRWFREQGSQWRHFPSVYHGDAKWGAQAYWNETSQLAFELGEYVLSNMPYSSKPVYVTLEYTKTT